MDEHKRLDPLKIIAALLRDAQTITQDSMSPRSLRLDFKKVKARYEREGMSFLTKTLPRLGKALDRALQGQVPLDSSYFTLVKGTQLPKLFGSLFERILDSNGMVLPVPCVSSIRVLRTLCFVYYKYEGTKYTDRQENEIVESFVRTEDEIRKHHDNFNKLHAALVENNSHRALRTEEATRVATLSQGSFFLNEGLSTRVLDKHLTLEGSRLVRRARKLLNSLFLHFDPTDIVPSHGPGAVSTGEQLHEKYNFTNVSARIAAMYPIDQYFYCSMGHVCDELRLLKGITSHERSAKVLLVPKDSRGPRLISCEPLEHQWVQQGLGAAIVALVERSELTRYNVHFSDQTHNRCGALLGSMTGAYATLDLKEASDRVSVGLVRALFPSKVLPYLESCRSLSTKLPDGRVIKLNKFAPMGSALCFPILALTCWAILTAGAEDADTRESILVYGDDVVVKADFSARAIQLLEAFGLMVNRDKSCTTGLFRESCGMDAFAGNPVTPFRIKEEWTSHRRPEAYEAYIAYANACFDAGYTNTYWCIVDALFSVYGTMPVDDLHPAIGCSSLRVGRPWWPPLKTRWNTDLQKRQYLVWAMRTPTIKKRITAWRMLLRYFTEGIKSQLRRLQPWDIEDKGQKSFLVAADPFVEDFAERPFSVSAYTKRGTVQMVRCWR